MLLRPGTKPPLLVEPRSGATCSGAGPSLDLAPERSFSGEQRIVAVSLGDLEFTAALAKPPENQMVELVAPQSAGNFAIDAIGRTIQMRWRGPHGVVRASGTVAAASPNQAWVVVLDHAAELVEERLFRRVPVQVDVYITTFSEARPTTVVSRSINVSGGGLALEFRAGLGLRTGEVAVVGIDPGSSRILGAVTVVRSATPDLPLQVRFGQLSGPSQDRLVSLINREELRLAR